MRPYRNTTRIRLKYECSSSGLLGLLLSERSEHSAPAAPRGPSGASAKLGDCTSILYIGNSAKSPHYFLENDPSISFSPPNSSSSIKNINFNKVNSIYFFNTYTYISYGFIDKKNKGRYQKHREQNNKKQPPGSTI